MKPPNETSGTCDAACSESELANKLGTELRKINRADLAGWRLHGEWIFNEFQRTGSERHLHALNTHLAAIRERCQI
jgi:hypothetical protein